MSSPLSPELSETPRIPRIPESPWDSPEPHLALLCGDEDVSGGEPGVGDALQLLALWGEVRRSRRRLFSTHLLESKGLEDTLNKATHPEGALNSTFLVGSWHVPK